MDNSLKTPQKSYSRHDCSSVRLLFVSVAFFCVHHKDTINVGEPGFPLTPGNKQKRAIVSSSEQKLSAGDRDTSCKFSIQPLCKITY
eukprot:TRINITY_DN13355_c0_g1_i1.p1 TRINITY_DN13355_c0_g1~~TRINITY_DN13355_c0_g1_i1.p1  ORF type:complete len:87 (-),score=5.23 TRINITY_DN13355_c0_g1_i1:177-437(-)